jgi:hypothetical protein
MSDQDIRNAPTHKGGLTSQDKLVLESITNALTNLRFGSIEIVVHEGKVTQIERKEKIRFPS